MLPSVSIYPHMGPGSKALKMDLGHLSTDSDTSDHLNCSHSGLRGSLPGGEGGVFLFSHFFAARAGVREGGGCSQY